MDRLKQIVNEWEEFLDYSDDNIKPIKNKKVKRATALMLENQNRYIEKLIGESTTWNAGQMGTWDYSTNAEFHKVAVPMVRRTFPELIAHEIVGVQPMTGPVGLAFAMRFVSGQSYDGSAGTEIGHNTIDSDYTGSHVTSTGEALGSNAVSDVGVYPGIGGGLGIGSGQGIKELNMTLVKSQVEAKTRKLRSRWSIEVAQDLENMHGLNIEEEMGEALAYEITAEIDRELIALIRSIAGSSSHDYDSDFDGRWESEKYRNLYNLVVRKSNDIATATRRGPGNWVVCNPSTCAAFETMPNFAVHPVPGDINTAAMGVARVGSMDGRFNVYRDTFYSTDEVLVGFKGISEYDTGVVYLPYIQLMMSKATFEDSYNPTMGLMSRYAIHQHLFGASNYYKKLTLTNMP